MLPKTHTILIKNARAMKQLAATIARQLSKQRTQPTMSTHSRATVVALSGDLGAGKTTFAQGFLKELGVKTHVSSPTFLIIRPYRLDLTPNPIPFTLAFHIDCYRLNKPEELLALGFKEILKNPKHIVLIEWPELVKKYLPPGTRWINIEHPKKGTHRTVSVR